MDNATKNKLVSGTDQSDLTSGNACWETPPLVFAKLSEDFGPFDVDLTADAQRHLCPVWFGPQSNVGQFDALSADWRWHGSVGYSNPPYGPFIQKLLPKAKRWADEGFTSVLLLPMRCTVAFKAHVLRGASDLLFCTSRITFFEDGIPRLNDKQWTEKGKAVADPAVFDSIIVVYRDLGLPASLRNDARPKLGEWEVPKHVTAADLARAVERRTLVA